MIVYTYRFRLPYSIKLCRQAWWAYLLRPQPHSLWWSSRESLFMCIYCSRNKNTPFFCFLPCILKTNETFVVPASPATSLGISEPVRRYSEMFGLLPEQAKEATEKFSGNTYRRSHFQRISVIRCHVFRL